MGNIEDTNVTLGTTLKEFKEFCGALDPETKGLALSNSDQIRSVHNSFARQTLFEFDSKKAEKDDDVFHFVSYVPINGRIYELDGLKAGPVDHGPAGDDWTDAVRPVIEARMMKYTFQSHGSHSGQNYQVQQSTEISEWYVHRFSNGRGCEDRNVVGRGGEQKIKMETRKYSTSTQLSSTYHGNAQITCQSGRTFTNL